MPEKTKIDLLRVDIYIGKLSKFYLHKAGKFCDFKVLQSAKMRILESDMTILRNLPGF